MYAFRLKGNSLVQRADNDRVMVQRRLDRRRIFTFIDLSEQHGRPFTCSQLWSLSAKKKVLRQVNAQSGMGDMRAIMEHDYQLGDRAAGKFYRPGSQESLVVKIRAKQPLNSDQARPATAASLKRTSSALSSKLALAGSTDLEAIKQVQEERAHKVEFISKYSEFKAKHPPQEIKFKKMRTQSEIYASVQA